MPTRVNNNDSEFWELAAAATALLERRLSALGETKATTIYNKLFRSLLRDCQTYNWHRLERLAYVVLAYRNRVVASRLNPSLPSAPGMASANAFATLAVSVEFPEEGEVLEIPAGADPVLAGAKWLDRLRRDIRGRTIPTDELNEDALILALLDLIPSRPGKPSARRD